MLKNWISFLEELQTKLNPDESFDLLVKCLKEFRQYGPSYTLIRKSKNGSNPEEDIQDIIDYLNSHDWTLEKISNLEKEMGLEEFNKKIDQHHISKEAYMDYFLYKITNGHHLLAGFSLDDCLLGFSEGDLAEYSDTSINELIIKFGYGWHNTKYGQLFIKQNLDTIPNFLTEAFKFLPSYIIDRIDDQYGAFLRFGMEFRGKDNFSNSAANEFIYGDSFFYLNLEEFYQLFKKYYTRDISKEVFTDVIYHYIDKFNDKYGTSGQIIKTKIKDDLKIDLVLK